MNDIASISSALGQTGLGLPEPQPAQKAAGGFGELLQTSLDRFAHTQTDADRAVEELTLGGNTDIHSTMIAVEKAGIALEMALQVRNKLLNAYETLMRQQI
jgi:flagellar hook-basal body complex protein FliE